MRKSLKYKQDPIEYERKAKELEILKAREDAGEIKLVYADESGFSLTPSIPSGYQPPKTYNGIVPQKSKQKNVFALLSRDNEITAYSTEYNTDGKMFIAYIDDYARQEVRTKMTYIVLDNASIHKTKEVLAKKAEWEVLNITLWFLPAYSPHLNIIEILWRKMKYEWLKPGDYIDWQTLDNQVDNILNNIGITYKINFARTG